MELITGFKERSRRAGGVRLLFPEGEDTRIRNAAVTIAREGWASPVLVTRECPGRDLVCYDPKDPDRRARYAATYLDARPDAGERVAAHIIRRPLFFGAAALAAGDADCLVAGATCTTANVIRACALTIGLAEGTRIPSSFFLMEFPDTAEGSEGRVLIYADCAVTVQPSADELADIAIASAESARVLLGTEPRLAMLSFSTLGSARHPDADKVRTATEIVHKRAPGLAIDGELQADSALVEELAIAKCPDSSVAGRANVLIFPDLDAGNIAYKLSQYPGCARAYGPVLQGFRLPCSDLSRGTQTADIVGTAAVVAAIAAAGRGA